MHDFFQLLRRNRNYRFTWSGQIVSEIGDNFNNIAVFALAMALTHSGLVVTGVLRHARFRPSPWARSPECCSIVSTANGS